MNNSDQWEDSVIPDYILLRETQSHWSFVYMKEDKTGNTLPSSPKYV